MGVSLTACRCPAHRGGELSRQGRLLPIHFPNTKVTGLRCMMLRNASIGLTVMDDSKCCCHRHLLCNPLLATLPSSQPREQAIDSQRCLLSCGSDRSWGRSTRPWSTCQHGQRPSSFLCHVRCHSRKAESQASEYGSCEMVRKAFVADKSTACCVSRALAHVGS